MQPIRGEVKTPARLEVSSWSKAIPVTGFEGGRIDPWNLFR